MPVEKKGTILAEVLETNKDCEGYDYIKKFNKAELVKARKDGFKTVIDGYLERTGSAKVVRKVKKVHKSLIAEFKQKVTQAKYNTMVKYASDLSKTQKARTDIIKEFKAGVIAIGKGNRPKGMRIMVNKNIVLKANPEDIKKKRIGLYNKLLVDLDRYVSIDSVKATQSTNKKKVTDVLNQIGN